MSDSKQFKASPDVTFSGAADPSQSVAGARVSDAYHQTTSGEVFRCKVETLGSQEWVGDQTGPISGNILSESHPDLVAMYTMDNINGSTLNDESPNGNNLTASGSPSSVTGKIGNAGYFFNTSDHYAGSALGSDPLLTATRGALCYWMKPDGASIYTIGLNLSNATGSRNLITYHDRGANNWVIGMTSVSTLHLYNLSQAVNTGQWYFIVYQRTDSGMEFYIDGVKQSLTTSVAGAHWLGDIASSGDMSLLVNNPTQTGSIDQCRLFNRALTQAEITALANET